MTSPQAEMAPPFRKVCAYAPLPNPGTPAACSTPALIECLYHDKKYAPGAVICVGPKFGQSCESNGSWKDVPDRTACANTPIPTSAEAATSTTTPPGLCTYHDVHYAFGAVICVAPEYGQRCKEGGEWGEVTQANRFGKACKNAQIPAPTGASSQLERRQFEKVAAAEKASIR